MKLYYETKTNGKCGCANYTWRVTEAFESKGALKTAKRDYTGHTVIKTVLTGKQVQELPEERREIIFRTAF